MHVAKENIAKLDPKFRLCIFLGYGDDEFGHRVWDLVDKSRHSLHGRKDHCQLGVEEADAGLQISRHKLA